MGTPDICLGKNLDQRPMRLQQTCPDGAESTVDAEIMPDDVTLSDGRSLGERADPPFCTGTVPLVRSVRGAQNGIFCRVGCLLPKAAAKSAAPELWCLVTTRCNNGLWGRSANSSGLHANPSSPRRARLRRSVGSRRAGAGSVVWVGLPGPSRLPVRPGSASSWPDAQADGYDRPGRASPSTCD